MSNVSKSTVIAELLRLFKNTKWYFPSNWTYSTWKSMNQYISTSEFRDPLNKKYRMVKLNDLGNLFARCALSMFEKHYINKSYMVLMTCNVFSMKEYSQFSKQEYLDAFAKIFPSAHVDDCGDNLHITIVDAFTQFTDYGLANGLFSDDRRVSLVEHEIWGEFAKFIKILCDNQIVEVKVRVSSCLPESSSTKVPDDE